MSAEYTHSVFIKTPESWIDSANHLACWQGESAADINTFGAPGYLDAEGRPCTCVYTVVKDVFLAPTASGQLGEIPVHAVGIAGQDKAQAAFDSLSEPDGIRMLINVSVEEALQQLGLTRMQSTEEV